MLTKYHATNVEIRIITVEPPEGLIRISVVALQQRDAHAIERWTHDRRRRAECTYKQQKMHDCYMHATLINLIDSTNKQGVLNVCSYVFVICLGMGITI